MEWTQDSFKISMDKSLLQVEKIHRYLSKEAYWCLNIPREKVEKAIEGSICFGVYDNSQQIGYARIVTDSATFAWLCDVYIEKEYQNQGLGKFLMNSIMEYVNPMNLRRFGLATRDAHGLYSQYGFSPMPPENIHRMMEIKNNHAYITNENFY